jgi:hypothetical protein
MKELIKELIRVHDAVLTIKSDKEKVIMEEVDCLMTFVEQIFPFATRKTINTETAVLIYVYPYEGKTLISSEVYITKDGRIVYQVYNREAYEGYQPLADIQHGYVYKKPEEFLEHVSLQQIMEFFVERVDVLVEDAEKLTKDKAARSSFINDFKNQF